MAVRSLDVTPPGKLTVVGSGALTQLLWEPRPHPEERALQGLGPRPALV